MKKNPTHQQVFTPSYEADSQEEYEQKVADGSKRDLHVMIEGGRRAIRYEETVLRQTPGTIEAKTKRWSRQEPPWAARTQSPESWESGRARKGVGPSAEVQIREAIERLTGPYGFVVPDTPWPLVEVGMPLRAAQILVARAARHLYPRLSRPAVQELVRSSLRQDIVEALRRPLTELGEGVPSGVLEARSDGRLVLPLPGLRARDAELTEVYLLDRAHRERIFTAGEVRSAYDTHREQTKAKRGGTYYPREDDPIFLDGFYRALAKRVRATAIRWGSPDLELALVFSFRGKSFYRRLPVREHSKSTAGEAQRASVEYKSLRNVDLADLPHLLARLASRKKRKGRQLPTTSPSRQNPMIDQDQLTAMLKETGQAVPVPGKPGRVYVFSKRKGTVIETTASRARTWQAIGAAGRAASQKLSQAAREAQENPMGRSKYDDAWFEEQYSTGPYGAQQAIPAARRNRRARKARGNGRGNSAPMVGPVLVTKNGQPYRRTADGKARFISKSSAARANGVGYSRAVLNPVGYSRAATENRRGRKPRVKRANPYAKAVFAHAKAIFAQSGCSWSDALRAAHAHVKGQRAAANPWYRSSHVPDLYLPDTTATRSALVASPFGPDDDLTPVRSALEQGPYGRANPRPRWWRDELPSGVTRHGHFFPYEENVTGLVGPGYDDFDNEMFDHTGTGVDPIWGGGGRARGAFATRSGQFSPTGTGGFQPQNRRNPRKKRKARKNKSRR